MKTYQKFYLIFIICDILYCILTYLILPTYNKLNTPIDGFPTSFFILLIFDAVIVLISFMFLCLFLINFRTLKKVAVALILNVPLIYWMITLSKLFIIKMIYR